MTDEEKLEQLHHALRAGLSEEEADALELERFEVSQNMQQHGGSFVRCLGLALAAADIPNVLKLKAAFPEYWEKYRQME